MQDFRPDDDLRMDRPSRVVRRPQPKKKNNSLQLYLFVGLGLLILVGLISAVWLILREPTVNIEQTSSSQTTSSGQLDLSSLNNNGTNDTNAVQTDNQLSLPSVSELPEIEQATDNQTTNNQVAATQTTNSSEMNITSPTSNRSTLPLDYATAGNKPVSAPNNAQEIKLNANQTANMPTQASNVRPDAQNAQPSTDFTGQPKLPEVTQAISSTVPDTKTQPKPDLQIKQAPKVTAKSENKPVIEETKITQQTATIKNSQPNVANTRPVPSPTIQQQEILTNANNIQESASALQTQINQGAQNSSAVEPKTSPQVKSNRTTPRSDVQQGPIDNGTGGDFTIQVASASQPEGLRNLAASRGLITGRVIETQRNGSKWYVLVTGNYGSRQEAQRAIRTLPSDLQSNGAWVRQK